MLVIVIILHMSMLISPLASARAHYGIQGLAQSQCCLVYISVGFYLGFCQLVADACPEWGLFVYILFIYHFIIYF
jgi:hypothetical protein